ncbi:MAG: alpha/beta hydrolase [Myxococcaceae bacterium]|nr:alpha/beta hydrolase [Myxococcaceae bacterium]
MLNLFLHSTGTTTALWAPFLGDGDLALANLGYPPGELLARGTRATVADEVRHLLAQIPGGTEPLTLHAHSYGGLVAMELARALGDRVKSFFLVEPVLFGALALADHVDPAAAEEARTFRAHPWFLTDEARGGTREWLEVFIDYWNRPGSWARMPAELQELQELFGWKMFQEVRSVFHDARTFADWRFTQPMTLVLGERSPRASHAMTRAVAQENPQAKVVVLPGSGHLALLTHPQRFEAPLREHRR